MRLAPLLLVLFFSTAQAQFWVRQGSGATNNMAYSIASDINGNTYTTGYFSSTINFDTYQLTSSGPVDMFIVKTDATGHILWAKSAGGNNITQGLCVAVNNNSVVVTGLFYGSATFDTYTITSSGQKEVFLVKYDLSGNIQWAKSAGGLQQEQGNKVAFDPSGNIVLTGEFDSPQFSAGAQTLNNNTNSLDVFTGKFDASGNCLWLKSGSGPYVDRGTEITTDASGNVYVAGEFSDTIMFDQIHYNIMYNALFVIKYNSSGQEQWFRWMGSGNTVKFKGLEVNNTGEIIGLGNFTSSLYFFGFPASFTLTNSLINNLFLCKLTPAGDLSWAIADGSNSGLSSECLAISPNQTISVGGTYQCRFDDFSAHYGAGVFCSLGYDDCFTANYDQTGTWLSAKCFGGNKNDYLFGIAADNQNLVCLAGGFEKNIFFPEHQTTFLGYPQINGNATNYCTDPGYYEFATYSNSGNSDVYLGKPIDPQREVFDWYQRNGPTCIRDVIPICIDQCEDTLVSCGNAYVPVNTNTYFYYPPEFHYLWNTGDTMPQINVGTTGDYNIQVTSYDGCFVDMDTIHVIIHPFPSMPPISDDHGINSHAIGTQPVFVCYPDSVILTGDSLAGCTYEWATFPPGQNPITVHQTGVYTFSITDSFGCVSYNNILVTIDTALSPIDLRLTCMSDSDHNDTVRICSNASVVFFVFDTLSNPNQVVGLGIPQENHITWSSSDPLVQFTPWTTFPSSMDLNHYGNFPQNGWYQIGAHVVRENTCGKDSFDLNRNIYIILDSIPSAILPLAVTGDSFICPGASTTMHVQGDGMILWSNGSSADSSVFTTPGYYNVQSSKDTINSYGCLVHAHGIVQFQIFSDTLPQLSSIPANALICPFDSVLLICSGNGTFTWQGPNGIINSTGNSIYVTLPGTYICIRDDGTCVLNSNLLDVYQYNTPLLIPLGEDTICHFEPTSMQIITGLGSVVTWQSPLSGNSLTQTITQPGTYTCVVTVCNITTPLSLSFPGSDPQANVTTSSPVSLCSGDSVQLTSGHSQNYLWSPNGETTQSITVMTSGNYHVEITDSLNCNDTTSINVLFNPNPLQRPIANDTSVCLGTNVVLIANGSSIIHWLDLQGSQLASGFAFNAGTPTNESHFLLYSDSNGCRSAMDSVAVYIDYCDSIKIPNVFTPGGDGRNDFFPGKNASGESYWIKIYNRWGRIVFDSSESFDAWNGYDNSGSKLSDGTYYYIVHVLFPSGHVQDGHGWVELINE